MPSVFFDSNLFIYAVEDNREFAGAVDRVWESALTRGYRIVTSAFAVGEVLVRPVREGDLALAERYLAYFAEGGEIGVIPFDRAAARCYAEIRADDRISRADAIQLACAASAGVDLFLTNDDRLSRKAIPGINFISSLMSAPL